MQASKLNSPVEFAESTLRQGIVNVFVESPEAAESSTKKVGRIAFTAGGIFLCFATEIPSVLNAKAFNPFPGASQISAGAVLVYSFFGADNVVELSRVLFGSSSDPAQKMTAGKVVRISLGILLGIFSRFRGAGLTLHVAPGISQDLRLPLAIAKILGTFAPEAFSVYNSLGMKCDAVRRYFKPDEKEAVLLMVRENLLHCLRAAKSLLLENADSYRLRKLTPFTDVKNETDLFNLVLTRENLLKAHVNEERAKARNWSKVALGTLTSAGTTCSLVLSAVLAKYADNTFFPGGDENWKWVLAVLSALTIAHTSYTKSFEGAKNTALGIESLVGIDHEKSLGRTLYPTSHALFTASSAFLVAALFGDHYESVKGSLGLTNLGVAVLTGIVLASFFLYTQAMQNIFDKTARTYATSRFADAEDKELAEVIIKLDRVEQIIESGKLSDFEKLLNTCQFTDEQREILFRGIDVDDDEESNSSSSSIEEIFSRMKISDSTPLLP